MRPALHLSKLFLVQMMVDRPSKSDAVKLHRLSDFMLADASSKAQISIENDFLGISGSQTAATLILSREILGEMKSDGIPEKLISYWYYKGIWH